MTMVRGEYSQLMSPGLRALFIQWNDLKQRDEEYSHIFNTEPSDKAYEDDVEFAGLPPMVEKPEGESVIYSDAIQGGSVRYINYTYALGVRCSFELYDDDQYGVINQVPKCLARSAHFIKEQTAWNVFNNGFTSIITTDGVSLFNNQHPLLGGPAATSVGPGLSNVISAAGTFPNRPATDIDLSFTGIQLMINQFERLVDAQGMPIMIRPRHLIIPPELKWIAREILGSPHKPYTADNEINAVIAEELDYFIFHYSGSQSAWYAVTDKEGHALKYYNREELKDDYADDFDTQSLKQLARMRFSVGATVWEGTWGSNGP
jgi:phage major head subunit gpT-like protein